MNQIEVTLELPHGTIKIVTELRGRMIYLDGNPLFKTDSNRFEFIADKIIEHLKTQYNETLENMLSLSKLKGVLSQKNWKVKEDG
jgi:hypothetical protein